MFGQDEQTESSAGTHYNVSLKFKLEAKYKQKVQETFRSYKACSGECEIFKRRFRAGL